MLLYVQCMVKFIVQKEGGIVCYCKYNVWSDLLYRKRAELCVIVSTMYGQIYYTERGRNCMLL